MVQVVSLPLPGNSDLFCNLHDKNLIEITIF